MQIGIIGCCGAMGKIVIKELYKNNLGSIAGGLTSEKSQFLHVDLGEFIGKPKLGKAITSNPEELFKASDVLIDFSASHATLSHALMAKTYNKPIVIGTTGISKEHINSINEIAISTTILLSSNMSSVIHLLVNLVSKASESLANQDFDIQIIEKHHKHKKDIPSGTAVTLSEAVKKGCLNKNHQLNIGFNSVRGGSLVGEHSVLFMGNGEYLELKHVATNRSIFAMGAINAAKWLVNKPAGRLYSFSDTMDTSL